MCTRATSSETRMAAHRSIALWVYYYLILQCQGTVFISENLTQLFFDVVILDRFDSRQSGFQNKTVKVITREYYEELCALDTLEQWRQKRSSEVLVYTTDEFSYLPCGEKYDNYATGKFSQYWCALTDTILEIRQSESQYRLVNFRFQDYKVPSNCTFLVAQYGGNISSILQTISEDNNLRLTATPDDDFWLLAFDRLWIQLLVRLFFPCSYLILVAQGLHHANSRRRAKKTKSAHRIILFMDVIQLITLAITGFIGGSHFLSPGFTYQQNVMLFSHFFGLGVAGDLTLSMMYVDAIQSLGSNERATQQVRTKRRRKYIIPVCLAASDTVIQLLVSLLPGDSRFVIEIWPLFLILLQLMIMNVMIYNSWRLKKFLVKVVDIATNENTSTEGITGVWREVVYLAKHLRNCSYTACFGNLLIIIGMGLFVSGKYKQTPSDFFTMAFISKIGHVVNCYARINAIRSDLAKKSIKRYNRGSSNAYFGLPGFRVGTHSGFRGMALSSSRRSGQATTVARTKSGDGKNTFRDSAVSGDIATTKVHTNNISAISEIPQNGTSICS
mmetsp:Transcript_25686/g.41405  ORF Transcript_25686/g.41405 Transcript_25686/m.41405 type:complete len:558 (-) Transcript_25686:3441-5114(-)